MPSPVTFRKVTKADFDLLGTWLQDHEVQRWFGDHRFLDQVAHYLGTEVTVPLIALEGSIPFGYIHHYAVHSFEEHPLAFLPQGARGLDCFIGPAAARGRGAGRAMVRALSVLLFDAGAPALGLDPVTHNTCAISCYAAAGFQPARIAQTDEGLACLMVRHKDAAIGAPA